ncbi:MAG TPA: acyltransferase, partial [Mucilaginibacter sp.]|nr:acyltransferase [Mucilaginibacter sp.]
FPLIHTVPISKLLLVMIIGCTLIPVPISMDVRGWQEMHPLDGPGWSLFFEYTANILYALFVRRFSKTMLTILVIVCGIALIQYTVTSETGDVVGGWSLDKLQLRIGFTRMMYPFFAGLLLRRMVKVGSVKNAFFWCTLLLVVFFAMPRIGDAKSLWMNGLYESLTIIFIFPLIVYIGASGTLVGKFATKSCKFLGEISYPLYITHYPLIYTYWAWISKNKVTTLQQAGPWALLIVVTAIVLAYGYLKLYDEPVRRWLTKRFGNA